MDLKQKIKQTDKILQSGGHCREVVKSEVLAEGTDSTEERGRRHDREEDSEEED